MEQTVPSQPMKRLEDWKSRLIDLSRKNNLLYFKKNKRGNLAVTQPDQQTVFNSLVLKKRKLEFYMPQEEAKAAEKAEKLKGKAKATTAKMAGKGKGAKAEAKVAKAPVKAAMQEAVTDKPTASEEPKQRPTANQLVCGNMSHAELERNLKGLQWRSLLDYRERGVRILHAAFGTLNWVDMETKEKVQSPLILVPLELTRDSIRQPYVIAVPPVEEEAVLNPALQTKLKNDYKIELPPLPEDWENQNIADYFKLVNQAVAEMGWSTEASWLWGFSTSKN